VPGLAGLHDLPDFGGPGLRLTACLVAPSAAAHQLQPCSCCVPPALHPHLPHLPCPAACLRALQDERRDLMQQMQQLQATVAAQQEELTQYAGNDPDRYDNLSEQGGGERPGAVRGSRAPGGQAEYGVWRSI